MAYKHLFKKWLFEVQKRLFRVSQMAFSSFQTAFGKVGKYLFLLGKSKNVARATYNT